MLFSGYFDELMSLLEASLGLERAHMGMFSGKYVLHYQIIISVYYYNSKNFQLNKTLIAETMHR